MDILNLIVQIIAGISGGLAALMSILLFIQVRWPAPVLWFLKLFASALSPLFFLTGAICTIAGLATASHFISGLGIYVAFIFFIHIVRVTGRPGSSGGFESAFGSQWQDRINPQQEKYFLANRTLLKLPVVPTPRFEQNVSFATIPETGRELLCDIWQPHSAITSLGLAFIYFHGAAWYMLDKDLGTRPFFSHLAAQGHVIMDVAYRLAPETDMMGMVHDVKRAIVWMKDNARAYGVNPDRIVAGGGSSGGHLALFAAYTSGDSQFAPKELEGKDMSVCSVISLYGPADLKSMYYHLNQHLTTRSIPGRHAKAGTGKMPAWIIKKMGKNYYRLGFNKDVANAGAFAPLLGGHPDECPETYDLYSPVTHVHAHCPPTMLIHGEDDTMAPVKATLSLFKRLKEEKIKTVMHLLPQTDHAFDLVLPKISPSAHNAIYDVERFLALFTTENIANFEPATLASRMINTKEESSVRNSIF